MRNIFILILSCSLFMLGTAGFALAANQGDKGTAGATHNEEMIYGSQMMTEQERNEYRARMQAAKSNEEREQLRLEHHERMKVRAKERGLSMPDSPPRKGSGMGGGKGKKY